MRLIRTKAGTRYLNELSRGEVDDDDFNILWWAGHKPIETEKLRFSKNRESVRRLFEAGYLEVAEDE